ncbi:glycoside hydrolase family 2 protein [Puia dinghuensis]|uniref:Beta-galactosidase n=1 Tax=Puia dinghuensis TaxID=1792502 RepID=A0A8J2UI49_9BACT|nr:sugar-binding domain-containing protein [Puia dinghuensis]GGB21394.1 beta-galactosidase [Puia dinghuensis]
MRPAALFLFLLFALPSSHAQQRIKYNFNPGWLLFAGDPKDASAPGFDDANWQPISLPHAFNEDDAFKKAIQHLTTGIAWYRKHFRIPASAKGKKVFLECEGIRQAGEFYLNGHWLGRSENGVMAFGFDLTPWLKVDSDNVIAARIDNHWDYKEQATGSTFEWNDHNFYANYGGINKNVWLHVMDPLHQTLPLYSSLHATGIYIYAKDIDISAKAATITAESEITNEGEQPRTFRYEVSIRDCNGRLVKTMHGEPQMLAPGQTTTAHAAARMGNLHFWSWGYGYLYHVSTLLKDGAATIDSVTTVTGFRKTAFTGGMLTLNDRPIQIKGYAQRTTNEWPALGQSVAPWLSDLSNHLIVESNGNLVRWMHVTPWHQDVLSCDRVGLMEAMPAGDAEKDVEGRRWQQRVELMRDAIIYNRNNPSIIFYECGNKGISEAHMQEMKSIRDQYDPYGGRAIGAREMLDSKTAEYGGEMLYIDKSADKPLWEMEYSRDEGLRKYWDEYSPPYHKDGDGPPYRGEDASIYNRNQDSHALEDIARWYDYWLQRPGTGHRISAGGVNIIFSESNTHYRGAENYRRSGEVDALRIPKDGFYAHQVMWDGWVDIERPRIHIIGHWNYAPVVKKDIYVVSSAEKVQLFINGRSLGWGKQSNRFLFTFPDVEWQPGTISATGYDARGKPLCSASHETAGKPAAIRLTLHTAPNGFKADGADLVLVQVEVTDAQGRRCPTDLSTIHFELTGPAEWRGGMAQGPDNYILSRDLPVECGVNRVLLRSTTKPGAVVLKATAEGLAPATLTFQAHPFKVVDGLALQMPDDGLPSRLDRGPTPATPSFKATRTPLVIASVTAGANTDLAARSCDDNETTDWHNDGALSTAWIEYRLHHPTPIGEIVLKLNNFRTRSYPLSILIDGQQVWHDSTPRSLGYTLIRFTPHTGSTIRIQLTAASGTQNTSTTEVNGKTLDDGPGSAGANAPGRLSIVEAEFYGNDIH